MSKVMFVYTAHGVVREGKPGVFQTIVGGGEDVFQDRDQGRDIYRAKVIL